MNKLRVWWIPQVPGKPFHVEVGSIEEGVKMMDTLAAYDAFQFENNIKPDYANVGGIEELIEEDGSLVWVSWCNDYTEDPREYIAEVLNGPFHIEVLFGVKWEYLTTVADLAEARSTCTDHKKFLAERNLPQPITRIVNKYQKIVE